MSEIKLKRRAKGKRPYYFDNPDVDRLLSMVMALAGELAVTRDRLDTLERVAEAKGLLSSNDIEHYPLDEAALASRSERHSRLFSEITRIISAELEGLDDTTDKDYQSVVAQVENDE
jgi:hypothetical protein